MSAQKDIKKCMEWIEQYVPEALAPEQLYPDINKAGIVPLYGDVDMHMLLIKPWAKKKHLGPPPWQLIKGTRMIHRAGDWEDYDKGDSVGKKDELEPLLCTALREGMEEAGLILENIGGIGSFGEHCYKSLSSGKEKKMHLYALLINEKKGFHWPDEEHPVTESMKWFDINKLPDNTREDAREMVGVLKDKLAEL